jgi:polysaccharide biosynthesis transport protein
MSEPGQTTLADYLRTLKRSRWLIALVTLVCAGGVLAYSLLQTSTYEATAQLTVRDPAQDLNLVGGAAVTAQQPLQLASAHAPQVTRSAVLERVKDELNRDQPLNEIRSLVDVEIDPNSFVVVIRARSSDAREAARIVNAFAEADAALTSSEAREEYAAAADRLQDRLKNLDAAKNSTTRGFYINRLSNLQVLSSVAEPVAVSDLAEVPSTPVSPKPVRNTAAAAVFGLLLGLILAYARGMLDRRLREPSDVEEIFEHPVLARLRGTVFGHTGSQQDLETPGLGFLDPIDSESFRMLRENVRYLAVDRDLRTILVTSATPEEGKSTVAACLAMANAAVGKQTLLVECDLRRRVLAGRFGIAEAPGLSDYLVGRDAPVDVLQLVQVPGAGTANGGQPGSLVAITAGSPPPRPADILSSERFADFLNKVHKAYERVIIDCPPLLPVADTLQIIPHVDCVLMCVRLNRTTRDQAEAARVSLDRLPQRPTGLVITDFTERDTEAYGAYYYSYPGEAGADASERDGQERAGAGAQVPPSTQPG